MWEMTRSILRGWFQREPSCRPGCWRCHDSCIPAGRPCWLSWLKVSEGHGDQQSCSVLFHPAFRRLCHCRGFDSMALLKQCVNYGSFHCDDAKEKFWLSENSGRIYPISCRSWWKWMHSCATKDGRNHLTAAQWHGFVMVFIVKEYLSVILEALLNLSPPSSAHLESRFLGFIPASDRKR